MYRNQIYLVFPFSFYIWFLKDFTCQSYLKPYLFNNAPARLVCPSRIWFLLNNFLSFRLANHLKFMHKVRDLKRKVQVWFRSLPLFPFWSYSPLFTTKYLLALIWIGGISVLWIHSSIFCFTITFHPLTSHV